jgi:D-alanyl-D-alanine carboxypeptidase
MIRLTSLFKFGILLPLLAFQVACSGHHKSIYGDLKPNEDGSIATDIPNDDDEFPVEVDTTPTLPDELSSVEQKIVKDMHANQVDKFSFLVVNAKTKNVIRAHLATTPRRLASITKLSTSLAALENVNGVSYEKVGAMLKASNNGEASRYVRLAAKAIDGLVVTGGEYTAAASCPSSTAKEIPAAHSVLGWLKKQLPDVDWTDADIRDGAGCDYGNHYSALQTVYVLDLADSFGKAYGGKSFEELLSIAGVEGTWKNFNTDSKGMIFAKTGTLSPNSNLAGYFYVRRGGELHKYYFTVFVEKRVNVDSSANARKFIEALVRNWINQLAKSESTLNISI